MHSKIAEKARSRCRVEVINRRDPRAKAPNRIQAGFNKATKLLELVPQVPLTKKEAQQPLVAAQCSNNWLLKRG